jgi:hypothetical protein
MRSRRKGGEELEVGAGGKSDIQPFKQQWKL